MTSFIHANAFTCEIDGRQDELEVQLFHRSVFKRLVRKAQDFALACSLPKVADEFARWERHKGRICVGPEFAWTVFFKQLSRASAADEIGHLRRLLGAASRQTDRFGIDAGRTKPAWAQWFARREDVTLGSKHDAVSVDRVIEAQELLKRAWPLAARNVEMLVQELVWVSGTAFWSGSNVNVFGAVFANPSDTWTVPYHYETLLHEAAHHSLLIKQTFDPYLKNPNDIAQAPLRPDKRPLVGVLHGVFALARMVEGHARYLSLDDAPNRDDAARLLRDHSQNLKNGIATIRENARFTNAGESLIASIDNSLNESRPS